MAVTTKPVKGELVLSHPTMCLHCHLIVEMFHERGADPVKGSWQCPRCGHKYLFSTGRLKSKSVGKQKPRKKFEIKEAQEEHEFLCLFCLFA